MGRPMELTTKTQKFKAKLWLCEEHPLSLCEQVAPIIDLMAVSNALFAKLRDFITLRLPPGFPVKIEIPIFHILNARITFGNLNGCDEPVPSVRGSPSSETPSPGSDSSSVSSSSSTTSCRGCEISPAGTLASATRATPRARSQTNPGLRACRAAAGDWSHRLAGAAAQQARFGEGFGMAAGYLPRPGPWRQLARPGPPALLYSDSPTRSPGLRSVLS
uniref:cDNA FLJ25555 fis, clone JTH02535 n=1 Tax=Homo sapiens TaxID=9606 RepID=Q8N7H6_HUMAN|nr:unnamed protein product [Homo sapiens]